MKNLAQIMFEMDNQDELLQFIPTGIPEMDYVTFFLCRGKLSILAARPGMGKTSIAVQIAQSAANRGTSVVWITNDHSCKQVAKLFDEYALPVNAQARIRIEDRITEINGVCDAIRKLEKQPDLIVVDYLQRLYRISQKGNSVLDSETACTALHDLAQSTNASILVLSGIKRSVETRNNHMPRCEDILAGKESRATLKMHVFLCATVIMKILLKTIFHGFDSTSAHLLTVAVFIVWSGIRIEEGSLQVQKNCLSNYAYSYRCSFQKRNGDRNPIIEMRQPPWRKPCTSK